MTGPGYTQISRETDGGSPSRPAVRLPFTGGLT
jgi:hypothetical protein